LLNKVYKNQKWTQWPEIFDEVALRTNALEIEGHLSESPSKYIFTRLKQAKIHKLSAENLLQLECLIAHLGGFNLINPVHGEDPTPCTLIKFVLLEVLEYLGFKPQNPVYSNYLKICTLKQELYQNFATWALSLIITK
jgi:hypothetical protein